MYKNILITSTSRDDQGTSFAFVRDLVDIKDAVAREMIKACIDGVEMKRFGYWSSKHDICGSDKGYIFGDHPYALTDNMLPLTVEHIVNYVLD